MKPQLTLCLDPGHGMGNLRRGIYDSGAVGGSGTRQVTEAEIVMDWANALRVVLMMRGHKVIRTRVDHLDPAPIGQRAGIAKRYGCDVLISLHCNAFNGKASGTETYYRGPQNVRLAQGCNDAVVAALCGRNRGIKTEAQSQHRKLAVLNFPRAVLIELGFIDHRADRECLLAEPQRLAACAALARAIEAEFLNPNTIPS